MHGPSNVDLVNGIQLVFRGLTSTAVLLLLLCGTCYAIDVFVKVAAILNRPQAIEEHLAALARMIDADKLVIEFQPGKSFSIGRVVALCLFGVGYLLWASIPLKIVSTVGRLLLAQVEKKFHSTEGTFVQAENGNSSASE